MSLAEKTSFCEFINSHRLKIVGTLEIKNLRFQMFEKDVEVIIIGLLGIQKTIPENKNVRIKILKKFTFSLKILGCTNNDS